MSTRNKTKHNYRADAIILRAELKSREQDVSQLLLDRKLDKAAIADALRDLRIANAAIYQHKQTIDEHAATIDKHAATIDSVRKSLEAPVPMLLWCPECGARHVDEGEFATKIHHTHSCQHCGLTWRPAVVPTVGVQFLPGFKSSPT